jgi:hypothetical protein
VVIVLTPLMMGRLDEGLRGEIKGGIKAWSEDLAWHPEVGGWAARGGRRRQEEAATVGRCGEGDEANRRGPHGSDVRERSRLCRSAQSRREYGFRQFTPTWLGPSGPNGDLVACRRSGPAWEGLGRILKKIPF